jgi:SAM-dependent methyltransferase
MGPPNAYRQVRQIASRVIHFARDAKRSAEFRQAKRILCSRDLTASEIRMLNLASLNVSASDPMYGPKDPAVSYLTAGLSAIRCIETTLDAAGQEDPIKSLLDFPCGYGRVLRFLKVKFPDSAIVGGEINADALDFCKRTFSIETFVSERDFERLAFPRKFDFIWCGSLVTHIDEKSTAGLLGFFSRHLLDGGSCVFTTHGERIAKRIQSEEDWFLNITPQGKEQILRTYRQSGYGFANYRGRCDAGISLTSPSRILQIATSVGTWKQTLYLENGWHCQDVYALTKLQQ